MTTEQIEVKSMNLETASVPLPINIKATPTILEPKTIEEIEAIGPTNSHVIVDFYKDSCAPCSMQSKVLDGLLLADGATTIVVKIKMEDFGAEYFEACGVRSLPTLKIFAPDENGQVVQPKKDADIIKTGFVTNMQLVADIASLK